jgi:hypothetical protein
VKITILVAALIAGAPLFLADSHHVIADDKIDFASIKTFAIGEGSATTTRPELNNKLILKKVGDAIRAQLLAKGLTEGQNRADVVLSYTVGQDRRSGPRTVFDKGSLLIQIKTRDTNSLVWQGVYTHEEDNPAKVAEKLADRVQKLFSEYPPKKKK